MTPTAAALRTGERSRGHPRTRTPFATWNRPQTSWVSKVETGVVKHDSKKIAYKN
jgi:hypothetical protein